MLRKAIVVQARVIGALMLRETRVRFGHSQFGYLWAIVQPTAWVVAISTIFNYTGAHPAFGDNIGLFIALGMIPYSLFKDLGTQLGNAFQANEALLQFPVVKEIDTVLARALLEVATAIVVLVVLLSALVIFTGAPLPRSLLEMLAALTALILFGFGVGLNNAVINSKLKSWMNVFGLLTTPLFLLSGIFFSLEALPDKFRAVVAWNPIIHGIEAVRNGYYQGYRASHVEISYLLICGLFLTLVGLAGERAMRLRRA